jgi:retron-type reverse transcriptase
MSVPSAILMPEGTANRKQPNNRSSPHEHPHTRLQEEQYEAPVPTVTDRVVQAALKLVCEPIFEADFLPCSYGFRPMRRAQDAIAEIQHMTTRGYEWVLEADIRSCFDTIEHTVLMDRIRRRVTDKKVMALVKAFLKAGVMTTTGDREDTFTGTPQGSLCSAEHNPPNEQRWVMRSGGLSGLVRA